MESRALQALVMILLGLRFTVYSYRLRLEVTVRGYDYGLRVPFTVWLRDSMLQRCSEALRLNQRCSSFTDSVRKSRSSRSNTR